MEKNQTFVISGTNDKLWNFQELISYLVKNQRQHISLKINPEAICLETLGIYRLLDNFEFTQVDIYTENQLEQHSKYNIIVDSHNRWLAQCQPDIPTVLHEWTGAKTFLSFYHRPTASRLGFASYLYTHHNNASTIHFSYETDSDRIQLYEFDKLIAFRLESSSDVANLLPCMPLYAYDNHEVVEVGTSYKYSRGTGIALYRDILVDIVSEAHVIGNTFYPTEKSARPMWLKKPFIMFSSRDYLCYMRQMGFKTFNDFWSEEYDGYEGRDRFNQIIKLIDTLASKSKQELIEMYQGMQSILDHNYNMLLNKTYTTTITPIT